MKRILVYIALLAYLPAFPQNKLVKYELVGQYSEEKLTEHWKKKKVPQRIAPVDCSVDVYHLTYYTQWHDGTPIKASGFYFVPETASKEVPLLCYHHGTRIDRDSLFHLGGEETLCMVFAASGYAVLMPDYVGLGLGEKFHLYHHIETEAMSSIDMIIQVQPGFN